MTEPKNALIKQYSYLFSLHHVDFHITLEALREIAAMALRKNTGARGLRAILERVLMQAMFDIPDDPDVTAVVVDAEAVHTRTAKLLREPTTLEDYLGEEEAEQQRGEPEDHHPQPMVGGL